MSNKITTRTRNAEDSLSKPEKRQNLNRNVYSSCIDENGKHKLRTNCCGPNNTSSQCNSASGIVRHIFDTVYPDVRGATVMPNIAGNFARVFENITLDNLPETIFYDPRNNINRNNRLTNSKFRGGKKNRKNKTINKNKKSKQNNKNKKNNKKNNKKTLKQKNNKNKRNNKKH
jgi:hypothetical protein